MGAVLLQADQADEEAAGAEARELWESNQGYSLENDRADILCLVDRL